MRAKPYICCCYVHLERACPDPPRMPREPRSVRLHALSSLCETPHRRRDQERGHCHFRAGAGGRHLGACGERRFLRGGAPSRIISANFHVSCKSAPKSDQNVCQTFWNCSRFPEMDDTVLVLSILHAFKERDRREIASRRCRRRVMHKVVCDDGGGLACDCKAFCHHPVCSVVHFGFH